MEIQVRRGTIVRLQRKNGYGFIRQDDGTRMFFHVTGVCNREWDELREGQTVEYEVIDDEYSDKPRAIAVVVV